MRLLWSKTCSTLRNAKQPFLRRMLNVVEQKIKTRNEIHRLNLHENEMLGSDWRPPLLIGDYGTTPLSNFC
jgi:hypothetical protein